VKAMVFHRYGPPDVLKLEEVPRPPLGDDEVLVKVHAVGLNAADWHLLRGDPFLLRLNYGLRRPKITILGADVAGVVEAVGKNVTRFRPGEAVFGDLSGCGFGGFAEYVRAPESALAPKPAGVTFEQAAATPMAAVTALQGLRDKGGIQPGQKVLIHGASGGVGTFAVQLARALGAEVTAVCSTGKLEQARALGAHRVIDYTREDFAQDGRRYDLILAANGARSIFEYRRALSPAGRYVCAGGSMKQIFQALLLGPLLSTAGRKKMAALMAAPNQADLSFVAERLASGALVPVIDRCYPLAELPEALRYLEAGHARGKVLIGLAA
jgi:NADPH:quinone reductase-like Zn-dependent oxidoreductase